MHIWIAPDKCSISCLLFKLYTVYNMLTSIFTFSYVCTGVCLCYRRRYIIFFFHQNANVSELRKDTSGGKRYRGCLVKSTYFDIIGHLHLSRLPKDSKVRGSWFINSINQRVNHTMLFFSFFKTLVDQEVSISLFASMDRKRIMILTNFFR